MGLHAHLILGGIAPDGKELFTLCATEPTDGLASMLQEECKNYKTEMALDAILSKEEIKTIIACDARYSIVLAELGGEFLPNIISPSQLKQVLIKLRTSFYIKIDDLLQDKNNENKLRLIDVITHEIAVLSEMIGGVLIAEQLKLNVYLAIEAG